MKFSHCQIFVYCKYGIIFQFKLKMTVHAAHIKRKFLKSKTFDTFLRKVDLIFMFLQEELASLVSLGKPFSGDLEG